MEARPGSTVDASDPGLNALGPMLSLRWNF
jgi:hypothetical protein